MSLDIHDILNSWPYRPGEVNVRRIIGDDGREKIQLRLDLGILQMETTGRPDGQRPFGHESLLDYYKHRLTEHVEQEGSADSFTVDSEACELLRSEGVMYYHRYLAEFVLGDYAAVERDTGRNLELFDFCRDHALDEDDQLTLEQYRPYVTMMHARARSRRALKQNQPRRALAAVKSAIRRIEEFYEHYDQHEQVSLSAELAVLHALEGEIKTLVPMDPRSRLQHQLDQAVADERYEDAASIRDQLDRYLRRHDKANPSR